MATLTDAQRTYYNGLERKVEEEKLQGSYKEYKKTGEQAMVYEKKNILQMKRIPGEKKDIASKSK